MLLRLVRIADRFATFPDENLGMEGMILVREKEKIESEIARIMELLGLSDEKQLALEKFYSFSVGFLRKDHKQLLYPCKDVPVYRGW